MLASSLTQSAQPAPAPSASAINEKTIGQAIRRLRQAHQGQKRKINAINRAALEFTASAWYYDQPSNTLKVQSASDLTKWYTIDDAGCTCDSGQHGKPCKHGLMFEAIQLVLELERREAAQQARATLAAGAQITTRKQTDQEYSATLAAVDDLF